METVKLIGSPDVIDYELLAAASKYYEQLGYRRIEVPWVVSPIADSICRPVDREPIGTRWGNLVASAEVGFLQLIMHGELPRGRWQAVSPCYRDEPVLDNLHWRTFIKLELFDNGECDVNGIIRDAFGFFRALVPCRIVHIPAGENYAVPTQDIITASRGIELGSYILREDRLVGKWACGTGLALPRISQAIKRER